MSSSNKEDMLSSAPTMDTKATHKVGWGVFFTILTFVVAIFFLSPIWVANEIDAEIKSSEKWVGYKSSEILKNNSIELYREIIIESGVQKTIKATTSSIEKSNSDLINKMNSVLKDIGDVTLLIIYQSIYRSQVILFWIPLFIPVLIALIVDGLALRKVKQHTFGWASANVFHLMKLSLVGIIPFILTLYVSFPIEIPVILPLIVLIVMGYSINKLLSNLQKVF
jgi:hypothetical protein